MSRACTCGNAPFHKHDCPAITRGQLREYLQAREDELALTQTALKNREIELKQAAEALKRVEDDFARQSSEFVDTRAELGIKCDQAEARAELACGQISMIRAAALCLRDAVAPTFDAGSQYHTGPDKEFVRPFPEIGRALDWIIARCNEVSR